MTTRKAKSMAQAHDERVRKSSDSNRSQRSTEDDDRQTDGTALTSSERRRLFRDEWTQQALPEPPKLPGFHLCWLSTTNRWDPIERRVRLGYEPVKVEEVKGFEHLKVHSGEWVGCVAINEMILFKLPEEVYQDAMREFHHNQPQEEEQRIVDSINQAQEEDRGGNKLLHVEGEGLKQLVQKARTRQFA